MFWRCICVSETKFIGPGFQKLEPTDTHRQTRPNALLDHIRGWLTPYLSILVVYSKILGYTLILERDRIPSMRIATALCFCLFWSYLVCSWPCLLTFWFQNLTSKSLSTYAPEFQIWWNSLERITEYRATNFRDAGTGRSHAPTAWKQCHAALMVAKAYTVI